MNYYWLSRIEMMLILTEPLKKFKDPISCSIKIIKLVKYIYWKNSLIFWTRIYWTNMFVKPVSVLTWNYCRNVAIPYVIAWLFIVVSGARCIYARSARLDLPPQHSLPIRRVRDKFALKVCNLSWSYFPWCCSYYRLSTVTSSLLLRDRIQ